MQRYFCDKKLDNTFTLTENDTYHIKKVMRMNLNEKVEIVSDKVLYITEIVSTEPLVKVKVLEEKEDFNELESEIILVQSLVKEQKMDYILQKATELGVSFIYPYQAERSVIKVNGKDEKKLDRWNKICKEASEQSKRNQIPSVPSILLINDLIKMDADIKILCTVNEKTISLKKVLQNSKKSDKMIIVVGPEGGFTDKEEKKLMDNGFISTSLGSSVLRTETAGLFVISSIRYHNMG